MESKALAATLTLDAVPGDDDAAAQARPAAKAAQPRNDATAATATQLATGAMALIHQVAAAVVKYTGPGPGGAPRQQLWVTEIGWSTQNESPVNVAGGLQTFFGLLASGSRAAAFLSMAQARVGSRLGSVISGAIWVTRRPPGLRDSRSPRSGGPHRG